MPRRTERRRATSVSVALVLAAFAHCIAVGWGRWGDWLIDTGRELELPRRMLEGERLYSDLRFYYGPLAPYVNAALYRAFGVRVEVLAVAGIASAALMCGALWMLARRLAGVVAATLVALAFVYACAFPHLHPDSGIFNFALPYTFSATYGIVAATWSLLFLVVHLERGGLASLAGSAALLAVTALAKLEPFFAIAAAHLVFLVTGGLPRRREVVAYSGAAAAAAAVYGALALRSGAGNVWRGVTALMNDGSRFFVRAIMGLDDPAGRVGDLAGAWAALAVALGASAALARWMARRPGSGSPRSWSAAVLAAALGLAVPWIGGADAVFAAATPLAVAGTSVHAVRLAGRARGRRAGRARLLTWVFAGACLVRIALRPSLVGYGFYLLAPFLVPLAVLLLRDLPRRIAPSRGERRAIAAFGAGMLLATGMAAMRTSAVHYAARDTPVTSSRGSIRVREPVAASIVSYLGGLPPGARVLVVPQSSALNFFGERRGADHMFSYLPMEFAHGEEAELIARWSRTPPDLIVMASMDMRDFGAGRFGTDYARACGEWIERHYRPLPGPFVDRGILLAVPR